MSENLFSNIPASLPDEIFETIVKSEYVHIERIVSKGHKTVENKWYDQEKNEWVLLIKGSAQISFDQGMAVVLKPGDYMNIPAHKKHRVDWTDNDVETIWLAVHY
ncbi:MAG: cupin domain-containing protein [Gammaproteobacteria bacterium]|nr:cupin domain-containing protein [Gammaproteobacteria bacterium]